MLKDGSTVVIFHIDGAQIYRSKQSDTWIWVWSLGNLSPDNRFKKRYVMPGGFIPGPNKPKNMDSFLFRTFHHLAALQNCVDGLPVWDGERKELFFTDIFFLYATADTPGMAYLSGLVGHSGRYGCRLYCKQPGRHKHRSPQYYPARLKPMNYTIEGCDFPDIPWGEPAEPPDVKEKRYLDNLAYLLASRNQREYQLRRLTTGIAKPSLLTALPRTHRLGFPNCCPGDIMHLASLNLTEVYWGLWCGTIKSAPTDDKRTWDWYTLDPDGDVWKAHGAQVAAATQHIPSSFGRPPRDPAKKMNSSYKAVEWQNYAYGLAPAMLLGIIPDKYWRNYCKVVSGIRTFHQYKTLREDLVAASKILDQHTMEFELLYYQRRADRLHFVRQSHHAVTHLGPETHRIGSYPCTSAFLMERMIGILTAEIRLHSGDKVYANLGRRGARCAQVNALKAIIPSLSYEDLEQDKQPNGSVTLEDGYVLLRARERTAHTMSTSHASALRALCTQEGRAVAETWNPYIRRWSRLRLPNGQVARSAWGELARTSRQVRRSRNIKVRATIFLLAHLLSCTSLQFKGDDNSCEFGEVKYYFQLRLAGDMRTFAVVAVHSRPDDHLLRLSSNTLWACKHGDDTSLAVIDVAKIESVVAVVPYPRTPAEGHLPDEHFVGRHFVMEKLGLEVMRFSGLPEDEEDRAEI